MTQARAKMAGVMNKIYLDVVLHPECMPDYVDYYGLGPCESRSEY